MSHPPPSTLPRHRRRRDHQSTRRGGLLIVNADDLGLDAATTDSILACFRAGRISSASVLVGMRDSARAAAMARGEKLPVRLHLNLTEPFDDPSVPGEVLNRQAAMVRHFTASPSANWICSPLLQPMLEACIRDQMQMFAQLFGESPREVDGHQHVHTCLNVLMSRSLGSVDALRATFNLPPDDGRLSKRIAQWVINGLVRLRFDSTQRFTFISKAGTSRSAGDLSKLVARARTETVELMTHPGIADERDLLLSDEWSGIIAGAPLGTLRDL